ncbi:MAG: hypothetical protein ACTSYM_00995 [Candidatus Baldrarchaeia archaeon]
MEISNKGLSLRLWILGLSFFLLQIFPYIAFGFGYIPRIISIPDLIDLILYPFVIGLTLYSIFTFLVRKEDNAFLKYSFVSLLTLHVEGHGLHWAANAIDVTMDHTVGVPTALHEYTYFLDEHLGHWLLFYALFGMLLYFLLISTVKDRDENIENRWLVNQIIAFIFGFSLINAGIEAQIPYETITVGLIFLAIPVVFLRQKLREMFKKRCLAGYMFSTGLWIVIFAAIYWLLLHGFPQPSEWM